jgi:hypothetical protein
MPLQDLDRARAALLALGFAACGSTVAAPLDTSFKADRAWGDLLKQVDLGPRPSGSEANKHCREWIAGELKAAGLEPKLETFKKMTPGGEIEFTNVYADFEGESPAAKVVLLVSHFDTKKLEGAFLGANDGASSTAVLLEIARLIAAGGKRALAYRFLFVDGEEAVRHEWVDPDNRYGSRHHAEEIKKNGFSERVRACILLDLVGDKDLHLNRDTNSDPRLVEMFFGAARKKGLGKFVDGAALDVRDDHLSFMEVGIRSLDLIDLEFGPHNAWWHTLDDKVENCSKDSLLAAGRIALLGLAELEKEAAR